MGVFSKLQFGSKRVRSRSGQVNVLATGPSRLRCDFEGRLVWYPLVVIGHFLTRIRRLGQYAAVNICTNPPVKHRFCIVECYHISSPVDEQPVMLFCSLHHNTMMATCSDITDTLNMEAFKFFLVNLLPPIIIDKSWFIWQIMTVFPCRKVHLWVPALTWALLVGAAGAHEMFWQAPVKYFRVFFKSLSFLDKRGVV